MIRKDSFTVSTEDFAAARRTAMEDGAGRIRGAVREALNRMGLPSWEMQIVDAGLELFDLTARAESEEWGPVIDDMRDAFALEMSRTLEKTKRAENPEAQLETITNWVTTASINAGTEAAVTADPDPGVGLEWITMGDSHVREPHKEANGQTVPTGQEFQVGDVEMLYPGQPVGDPSNWINCRCTVRPTMLSGFTAEAITAAADAPITSTVIVALPAATDPISAASSERSGAHATLLFLGDSAALDEESLKSAVEDFVTKGNVGVITEAVNGRATLGKDGADVVLFDAANLVHIRDGLLEQNTLLMAHASVEQFPTWLPHVTLGYPDTPAAGDYAGEAITFDRLAVWHGESRTEYPLGGAPVTQTEPLPDGEAALVALSALTAAIESPEEIAATPAEDEDELSAAVLALEEEAFPEVPWYGVLAPESIFSGDKRLFNDGALTQRPLPLPLKFMWEDDEGHKGSYPVGRIDNIWRENGLVKAEGVFDTSAQAYETVRLLANKIMRGVSVDLDAAEAAVGEEKSIEFSKGRISSATVCSIPAFAEAFVSIGRWADAAPADTSTVIEAEASTDTEVFDNAPVRTKDGPGWITHPNPTDRITGYWVDGRGAAKIGWGAPGDFNRCRVQLAKYVQNPEWLAGLCANLHYRALGAWPGQASLEGEVMNQPLAAGPAVSLVASGALLTKLPADHFRDPQLKDLTPFTITEDGHIFGHLAGWETCHIGYEVCTTAPPSVTDYAYFLTGQVFTDAGPVPVGQITLGTGHAGLNKSLRAAIAHYDNTGTAVADITVGEDMHGVWFSGRIRDGVTEKQVRELLAASISGDWRPVRHRGRESQEMVAALAVNVPGFPIPRTSFAVEEGRQLSLVAAGIVRRDAATVDPVLVEQIEQAFVARQERELKRQEIVANLRTLAVADIKKNLASLKGK